MSISDWIKNNSPTGHCVAARKAANHHWAGPLFAISAMLLLALAPLSAQTQTPDTAPRITMTTSDLTYVENSPTVFSGSRIFGSGVLLGRVSGGNGMLTHDITPDLPPGLSFDSFSGLSLLEGSPTVVQAETEYVYTVGDSDTNTGSDDTVTLTFTITVQANVAPSFGGAMIPAQSYMVNQPITPVTLPSATGGNGRFLIYDVTQLPQGLMFRSNTRVLSGTPTMFQIETEYTYTAADRDGHEGDSDSATLMFTIEVTSDPEPSSLVGDTVGMVAEDGGLTDSGTLRVENSLGDVITGATFSAPDGLDGAYGTFTLSDVGGTATWGYELNNAATDVQELGEGDTLEDTLLVRAVAGTGFFNPPDVTVTVTVTGANDNPMVTIDAPAANMMVMSGSVVAVAGSGVDVDAGETATLSYMWSAVPDVGRFTNATAANTAWMAPTVLSSTSVTLSLSVSDSIAMTTDMVTVTVMAPPDTAPRITMTTSDLTYVENSPTVFTGSMIHGSGVLLGIVSGGNGMLTHDITPDLPPGLSFDATGGLASLVGSPTVVQAEREYVYTLGDSDANTESGDTATLTFTITVEANVAPSFGGAMIPAQSYMVNQPITPVTLPPATGGNGRFLIYDVTQLPQGLMFNSNTRVLSGTPTMVQLATEYTYTTADRDGHVGDSDSETLMFTIAVSPSLSGTTMFTVVENTGMNAIVGTPLMPEGFPSGPRTWAIESGNTGNAFDIDSVTGQLLVETSPDFETLASYTLTISLTVGTTSATTQVTITVTDAEERPGRPAVPTVTPGPTSLTVDWLPPTNTGPPITAYGVRYRIGSSGAYTTADPVPATNTRLVISGLNAGSNYEVQVRANNAEGNGLYSNPGTGTPLEASEVVPTTIGPAAALAGAVTEAGATDTTGMPTASGALMLLDAGSTEVPGGSYAFASGASGTGLYGDLTLNANGTWSYMLNNGAPATEALAGGASMRDTFDIEGSLGATTLAGTITLTVTGANDAPSAAITAPATAEVGTSVNLVGSASADPDSGDSIASHAWMFTSSDGGDGTLGNAALADTSFTPSAAGTVVLTLTVTDSATPPATGTALHTLTVSDPVPTTIGPAAALAGAVTEAGATDPTGLPTASGALMLLDASSTEVPGGSYAFASGASGTGLYGDLTLNANGTWSYMLNNGAPATEALAGGAEERDTFNIEGSLGATTLPGTITLTVTGANDAPSAAITAPATAEVGTSVNLVGSASADPDSGDSIASHAWTFTGSDGGDGTLGNAALADTSFTPSAAGTVVLTLTVTDSATPPATGTAMHTLTVSEVVPTTIGPAAALAGAVTEAGATDTTGMPTASGALMLLDAGSTEVPGGSYAFASGASGTGLYGDLTLNANGTWSYMLDNGAPATEALAGGAEERDTFDIEGSLGVTTLSGTITLTVTGANDAPSAAITAPASAEVGTSVNLVGSASADPDSGDSIASHAWTFTSSDGGDGTLGNAALADTSFTPSAAGTVVLTLTVTDSATPPATGTAMHTLTVSDPVPTTIGPAAALAGAVTEAGATDTTGMPTASGALMLLDAGSTEVPGGSYAFASGASGTGLYGDLTLNANGTWSYMLDNGAPATEALAGGAEERDTFDIEGSLGVTTLSGTITLTVTGANDAPSAAITAPATAEVGTSVNLVGSASADPDSGDSIASHAWTFTSSDGGDGTLGNAALADTSFTPSAAGTVVLTLTVTDSATPPATGTAMHTLTVSDPVPTTIGPAAALAGAVTEAGATDTTGMPTASGALMRAGPAAPASLMPTAPRCPAAATRSRAGPAAPASTATSPSTPTAPGRTC